MKLRTPLDSFHAWPLDAWRVLRALLPLLVVGLAAAFMHGCGGGVDSGGTGRTVASFAAGPIAGFGSVVVHGVHYDESAALVVDATGAGVPRDGLRLGQMVQVDAEEPTESNGRTVARAVRIRLAEELLGTVDSVALPQGTLVVLGQAVQTVAGTVLGDDLGGGLASVRPGDLLRVHGQLDPANARIVASRIDRLPGAPTRVVRGLAARVDAVARTLAIGSLAIDFSSLPAPSLPSPLADGLVLRAELDPVPVSGRFRARSLVQDALALADRPRVQLEGRVTRYVSPAAFDLDGVPVDAASALFPNGTGALRLGARVEVEGASRAGRLSARTVKVESDDDNADQAIELEGTITALDRAGRSFVLRGVVVDFGQSPRYEGGTEADLAVNVKAAVKGRLAPDRLRVVATLIHLER